MEKVKIHGYGGNDHGKDWVVVHGPHTEDHFARALAMLKAERDGVGAKQGMSVGSKLADPNVCGNRMGQLGLLVGTPLETNGSPTTNADGMDIITCDMPLRERKLPASFFNPGHKKQPQRRTDRSYSVDTIAEAHRALSDAQSCRSLGLFPMENTVPSKGTTLSVGAMGYGAVDAAVLTGERSTGSYDCAAVPRQAPRPGQRQLSADPLLYPITPLSCTSPMTLAQAIGMAGTDAWGGQSLYDQTLGTNGALNESDITLNCASAGEVGGGLDGYHGCMDLIGAAGGLGMMLEANANVDPSFVLHADALDALIQSDMSNLAMLSTATVAYDAAF